MVFVLQTTAIGSESKHVLKPHHDTLLGQRIMKGLSNCRGGDGNRQSGSSGNTRDTERLTDYDYNNQGNGGGRGGRRNQNGGN